MVAAAFADGTFAKLGDLAQPEIPYQRAIVAHRDGVETMVVESTLNGPPGDYVWIVPVPSPPMRVMEVEPAGMNRVNKRIRPIVSPNSDLSVWLFKPLGLWFLVAAVGFLLSTRRRHQRADFPLAIVVVLLGLVVVMIFAPVFAGPSSNSVGVRSLSAHSAGSYRVDVLDARDGRALRKWVEKRGGTLSAAAQAAADDYVRDGWCFAVAQLKRHEGGEATPHPLALEFRTKEPVYPMRLTGTQPGNLLLDLYVVADGTAEVEPLRVWVSQPMRMGRNLNGKVNKEEMRYSPLEAVAWQNSTVTRLRGFVTPAQMRRDYKIEIKPSRSRRIRVITAKSAQAFRLGMAFLAGSFAFFVAALVMVARSQDLRRRIVVSLLVGLVAAGGAAAFSWTGGEQLEPGLFLSR